MFTISKDFAFSASHVLANLPKHHQCARLHGHNYIVRVELSARTLNAAGFVLDYGALAPLKAFIDNRLDHRHLNDALPELGGPDQPSAELMARWLATEVIPSVLPVGTLISFDGEPIQVAVSISETPKTWARFAPNGR